MASRKAGPCKIKLLPSHFQHCDVVERLAVRGVDRGSHLERLIGQSEVSKRNTHVADVVPDVSGSSVVSHGEGAIETAQGHVVLRGVEAAEAHVVPQFTATHTALDQTTIESEGYFGLVCVEVVAGKLGD